MGQIGVSPKFGLFLDLVFRFSSFNIGDSNVLGAGAEITQHHLKAENCLCDPAAIAASLATVVPHLPSYPSPHKPPNGTTVPVTLLQNCCQYPRLDEIAWWAISGLKAISY